MFSKKRKNRVLCPECNQWYAKNAMVVINYGEVNQTEVCMGCYEDNHFIPPEALKKGEENVGNC